MIPIPFDVNDAVLRDAFLRDNVERALVGLTEASAPAWGAMTAQQMVEHLVWAYELATGHAESACFVPAEQWPRIKQILFDARPMPREYPHPAHAAGLPPLRHGSLDEARAALRRERELFLAAPPADEPLRMHPIFGPLTADEWLRVHYKHTYHHLLQFGLIASE